MSYTVSKLLAIAIAELGYKEKESNAYLDDKTANAGDNNWTKYARDLHAAGYYQANKNGYAWCDMFVDWCFYQLAGKDADKAQEIICQTGPYGAGCKFSAQYYKQAGRFHTSNPQPGDQIFFNSYAHTGIVEKIVGTVVHTIEGNTSNMVARRTYTLGSGSIDGYGRPVFDLEEGDDGYVAISGDPSTGSAADEQVIWNFLKGKGLNDFAVAGVMGNLYAESGLRSDNLENVGNKKLNLTDEQYTDQIDAGQRNFIDGHGYGLAQWTYSTRKKALLNFAKAAQKSICDLQMQLDFLWKELSGSGFKTVMNVLKSATSVRSASDIFMEKFENPYDQSEDRKKERAEFGLKYYNKYASVTVPKDDEEPETSKPVTPAAPKFEEGDIVQFKGGMNYTSSNGSRGFVVRASKAKITDVYAGKHPYHCRAVNDAGKFIGGVYGWVDEDLVEAIVVEVPEEVTEGCKVTIAKGATYGGLTKARGRSVPYFVYANGRQHTVVDIATHKGVLEALLKEINSWVPVHFLTVV